MFKRILVPTDLAEATRHSLEIAIHIASQSGGKIYLLHVIETLADTDFKELEDFYLRLENRAYREMDRLIAAFPEATVETQQKVAYGSRSAEVVRFASGHAMDLIILNSHRIDPEDPARGWGTISHKVGILAECPVMLVK
jgi:universal stress protein A